MAAPMTKLLFVFLLGITSWSHYVVANNVIATGINAEVADGNEVINSWETRIENNIFKSNIGIKDCSKLLVMETTTLTELPKLNNPIRNFCSPLLMQACLDVDGNITSDCNIEEFGKTLDPGTYEIKEEFKINDAPVADLTMSFTVQSE